MIEFLTHLISKAWLLQIRFEVLGRRDLDRLTKLFGVMPLKEKAKSVCSLEGRIGGLLPYF